MRQIVKGYYNVITWKKQSLEKHSSKNILQLEVENDDDYLLFLKFESHSSIPNIDFLKESLEDILSKRSKMLIILTPQKPPPIDTASEDELVFSFCCDLHIFKKTLGSIKNTTILSTDLLFILLDRITTESTEFDKILAKQLPFNLTTPTPNKDCDVIIPHRGHNSYLRNVLNFLTPIKGTVGYVGIDQSIDIEIEKIKFNHPDILFYNFNPTPVGPYVIRNRLIDQGKSDLIFFQDSDDIPCADRFERISAFVKDNNCQLCGSHELRMDYYSRTIRAVRFPLDVIASLKSAPRHPLLHPASAIERKAFYECGKLSEERTFGNDTKFLLRSFFNLNNIKNIDEFLYIRKRHSGSLTTSISTMLGSSVRRELLHSWNRDFERIKNGTLQLEASSLQHQGTNLIFKMSRL